MQEARSAAQTLLGQELEGYLLVRVIGEGGMGYLYEAVHAKIGQRAAIKILRPEFSSNPDSMARFVAEAQAVSRIPHPGIVKVFGHGFLERESGKLGYLIMEYLPGPSLAQRLKETQARSQGMAPAETVRLGLQIARTLARVHELGIVHRDIKPQNLLLAADPEAPMGERVKIVDFGIARVCENEHAEGDVRLTTVGRFLGTARYASPEQCRMAGDVDAKADVYSLGVVLYEMIAGKAPFSETEIGVVLARHISDKPRPLWRVAATTPPLLRRLVHRMLQKSPSLRPSIGEVVARLEDPRILRFGIQERLVYSALGAALLCLLVGVSVGLWFRYSARAESQPKSTQGQPGRQPSGPAALPIAPKPTPDPHPPQVAPTPQGPSKPKPGSPPKTETKAKASESPPQKDGQTPKPTFKLPPLHTYEVDESGQE